MELLERDHELQALAVALGEATAGEGRIVLVSGEAGIGKTSFVDRFIVPPFAVPAVQAHEQHPGRTCEAFGVTVKVR